MTTHKTGTREEWLAARIELLKAEKELTHASDELAQQRQALPWVRIDKPYRFDTDQGPAPLADLFRGRSQLLIYHFMFGPDYTAGCPACSAIADGFNGSVSTWPTTTSCSGRCRGRRSRSCRRTSGGWGGASPGRPHSAAISTTTSMSTSRRSSSGGKRRVQLPARGRPQLREGHQGAGGAARSKADRGDDRHRLADLHPREPRHECLRARGWRRLSHLFGVRARGGRALGHVPVARPGAERAERVGLLDPPPRRVRRLKTRPSSGKMWTPGPPTPVPSQLVTGPTAGASEPGANLATVARREVPGPRRLWERPEARAWKREPPPDCGGGFRLLSILRSHSLDPEPLQRRLAAGGHRQLGRELPSRIACSYSRPVPSCTKYDSIPNLSEP